MPPYSCITAIGGGRRDELKEKGWTGGSQSEASCHGRGKRVDRLLFRLVKNNVVAVGFVLPNLAINFTVQTVLDVVFGWSGWMAVLAWMIGGGLSLEFGILLNMATKSNFRVGKWRYSYAAED